MLLVKPEAESETRAESTSFLGLPEEGCLEAHVTLIG